VNPCVDEVERAFQLAKTGLYQTIGEIKKKLIAEGYWGNRITGPVLMRQLRQELERRSTVRTKQ
jgi:hypothetical protein